MRFHLWSVGVVAGYLLLAVIAEPVAAQADSGARVRVITSTGSQRRWIGTLLSKTPDSLRLISTRDSLVTLPTSSIVRFEQSRGRRTSTGRGALIGGLIGAGTGLLLGVLASTEDDNWLEIGPGEVFTASLVLGGMGAGLGALIGSISHRDQWEPVALPFRPGATSVAGPRLGLVLRF